MIPSGGTGRTMKRNGFSLIELLVVIGIMSALISMAGLAYSTWMNRYRLEGQVKEMLVDIMNARAQAMQKNVTYFMVVAANNYSVIEDTNENGVPNPNAGDKSVITNKTLKYQSNWVNTITMNTRGIVSPQDMISFNTGGATAEVDCISLDVTRIRIGRLNGSNVCVPR